MKLLNNWRGVCFAFLILAPCLLGQTTLQQRPVASEYILGTGDELAIHVSDLDGLSDRPIRIDPAGMIDIPLAGQVKAAGLTIPQLKTELSSKLARYIAKPDIALNLAVSGSRPVSVIGEVANPGVHQLEGTKRLMEVLSLSGGLKADAGPKVLVTRLQKWGTIDVADKRVDASTGDTTATFSLDALMISKAPGENIIIFPGDVISVPKADLVYVVGDVKKAGAFQISTHETVSLTQAVTMAEGLGPDSAAHSARILRPVPGGDGTPRQIPVDVDKIFAGKSPDVRLFANDVLYIPRSGVKVTARRALDAAIGVTSGILIYHR